jgi:hypothetical protein
VRQQTTWSEEFSIGGRQLIAVLERLVAKGNVRRLVVIRPSGTVLFETSLTTRVAVAGAFIVMTPVLTALGAVTALLTEVRVRVVHCGNPRRRQATAGNQTGVPRLDYQKPSRD